MEYGAIIDVVELRGGSAISYSLDSSTCILHSYSIIPTLTAVSILLFFLPSFLLTSPFVVICCVQSVCLVRCSRLLVAIGRLTQPGRICGRRPHPAPISQPPIPGTGFHIIKMSLRYAYCFNSSVAWSHRSATRGLLAYPGSSGRLRLQAFLDEQPMTRLLFLI